MFQFKISSLKLYQFILKNALCGTLADYLTAQT